MTLQEYINSLKLLKSEYSEEYINICKNRLLKYCREYITTAVEPLAIDVLGFSIRLDKLGLKKKRKVRRITPTLEYTLGKIKINKNLNNLALTDFTVRPEYYYSGTTTTGFESIAKSYEQFELYLKPYNTDYNSSLFNDILSELFIQKNPSDNFVTKYAPRKYSFLTYDNYIFGDDRDLLLLNALTGNTIYLTEKDIDNYLELMAIGLLSSLYEAHDKEVEKLKTKLVDTLKSTGYSFIDINTLLTENGLKTYFSEIGSSFAELYDTTMDIINKSKFDINSYSPTYKCQDEIDKWTKYAKDIDLKNYSRENISNFLFVAYMNKNSISSLTSTVNTIESSLSSFEAGCSEIRDAYEYILTNKNQGINLITDKRYNGNYLNIKRSHKKIIDKYNLRHTTVE